MATFVKRTSQSACIVIGSLVVEHPDGVPKTLTFDRIGWSLTSPTLGCF